MEEEEPGKDGKDKGKDLVEHARVQPPGGLAKLSPFWQAGQQALEQQLERQAIAIRQLVHIFHI